MRNIAVSIVIIFNRDFELLKKTLPQNIRTLGGTGKIAFEVILVADGSSQESLSEMLPWFYSMPIDELRVRRRDRHVASGAPSNNAHLHNFKINSPYLVVLEDDVVLFKTTEEFNPLEAIIALFKRHPNVTVITKMDDHENWAWQLTDLGPPIELGIRSVNRVATHFIAYETERFIKAIGYDHAFDLEQFIDRPDCFNNWEDIVSRAATTGGRRIAYPECWPLLGFHCDNKIAPGSPYNTQDPAIKMQRLEYLTTLYGDKRL